MDGFSGIEAELVGLGISAGFNNKEVSLHLDPALQMRDEPPCFRSWNRRLRSVIRRLAFNPQSYLGRECDGTRSPSQPALDHPV